jgi:hypothetical protein
MVGTVIGGPAPALLHLVVLRLALGQAQPPAVVVDHDRDVVGILERLGRASKVASSNVPLRRGQLPDQLGEVVPVLVVAGAAALGGEVELVPPFQFGLRRQGRMRLAFWLPIR